MRTEDPREATRPPLAALFAGYAYLAIAGVATLVLAPLYLRLMGAAAWGAVAQGLALQGLLLAFDAALAPRLMRDTAQCAAQGRPPPFARHLRAYAWFAVAGCGAALFALAAGAWPRGDASALHLALLAFLPHWFNLAALGHWHGSGRQPLAYGRAAAFLALKHAVALLLVWQWRADAAGYFLPFVAIGLLECGLNLHRVGRELRAATPGTQTQHHLADRADGGGWFLLAALLGLAVGQIDRLWLAQVLAPQAFGIYFLLAAVLLALLHLHLPLQRAFLPRLAAAPAAGGAALRRAALLTLALPPLLLVPWAQTLLHWWLRDAELAAANASTLRALLAAAAGFALAAAPSAHLLRDGRYRAMAGANAAALAAQIVVLAWLAPRLGALAGGLAWGAAGLVLALSTLMLQTGRRP